MQFYILLISLIGIAESVYEQNPFLKSENNKPFAALSLIASKPQTTNRVIKEELLTSTQPLSSSSSSANSFCLQPKGQFPSKSCKNYVNCWNGVAIEQTCPDGLLFNPIKLYCDYAVNVNCQGKPTPTIEVSPTLLVASVDGYNDVNSLNFAQINAVTTTEINSSIRKFCLRSAGLFPGSKCNKFVNCWGDFAIEQDCPEGLYFSKEGFCDYPQNVDCIEDYNNPTTPSKLNNECPLEFGTFRNSTDCSKYYICAHNKIAAKFSCPEGLKFSDILGLCDYSYRVDCSRKPQIYQRNPAKTSIGDNCPVSFGLVRDSIDCSLYHVCEFGKVIGSHTCPEGYNFSNKLNACDNKEKVNCNSASASSFKAMTLPPIPEEILAQAKNCVPGTVFRLNPQCSSACICRKGIAEIVQCSNGLAYDARIDKCVLAHLAQC